MRRVAVCALLGVMLALMPRLVAAAPNGQPSPNGPNQAGVVVVHGDGRVISRCVGFDEEQISGQELLARAGFDLHMDVTAMGASVCSLDGEGCGAGSACFCQCLSSPCIYWSYWRWQGDGWIYAPVGPGGSTVVNGSLDGWVWGEGIVGTRADVQPPMLAYADICTGDNWVTGGSRRALGRYVPRIWLWAALIIAAPLGVGGWLIWRRRQA